MDGLAEKLRDYAKHVLESKECGYAEQTRREDWCFGAIDFAAHEGLIDIDTYKALLKEFEIV